MKTVIKILLAIVMLPCLVSAQPAAQPTQASGEEKIVQKAYAWTPLWPSGLQEPAPMDTLDYNYFQRSIPSAVSYAYACTGNLGAEGKDMLFMQQQPISQFFLLDAQRHWIPTLDKVKFYNTRIPMTIASYNFGGNRDNGQDRLQVDFSGNINKRAQVGATLDYLYSKGCYANQAAKGFTWGFNGSYIGDQYEFQGSWTHFNNLNKENGGITNDLYITDPAKLQGGVSSINPKSIPTNLTHAHTRVKGGVLFLNNRYKLGFWRDEMLEDSTTVSSYVPVTSFFWTMTYLDGKHRFLDDNYSETDKFFAHTYLNPDLTDDHTSYWALGNTAGVSMLEGFNRWA
ncbi:MAG: putative porin, partial [Muribaculaceae bacterium]|nr:putative porin [Muribaculaceae bacterium]